MAADAGEDNERTAARGEDTAGHEGDREGLDPLPVIRDPDRLAGVRATGLLDTSAESDFDRWTSFVRRMLGADVSLITLLDRDRQFFKSAAGLGEPWVSRRETPLSHSFCKHVVFSGEILRVSDARRNPTLADNLAIEEMGVVAYLGVPLRSHRGRVLGAMSAIQREPRDWSDDDLRTLQDAAAAVEAEIEVRSLKDRTRAVMANLSDMVSIVDETGRTLYRSPSIRRILGHDLTAETGVRMDLIHPDDRVRIQDAVSEVLEGSMGRTVTTTVRVEDAEGRYRTLESRVTNLVDDPAVGGVLWVARDITDRVSLARRLSLLLRHAPVALWTVDRDLRFTWAGGRALSDLGMSDDAVMDLTVYDVLESDDSADPRVAAYEEALQGEVGRFDTEWGGRVWAVHVGPMMDADSVVGVVGVALDVTHYREVERRLEERTAHFRRLFEEAPEAIVILDDHDRVIEVNPEFERLFGYGPTEAEGRPLNDLIAPAGREEEASRISRRVVRGERVEVETVRRHKDGSLVEVSILATPAQIGDERQLYGIYRDITERKELEARLLHSGRLEAVGQLAGGIAHDFNNILTAILGHTQMLLARYRDDPRLRNELVEVQEAGERAARLTRQLLTFSRKDIASPRHLDVNEVVAGTRSMLERLIEERIRLSFELGDDLPRVELDPGQLEQMIVNLVINARDATPSGGRVTVSTSRCAAGGGNAEWVPADFEGVLIEVADEGEGMTPEARARIFEPFFTTKMPGEGTGLGLSTVYGIVERAGGFIDVDSAPGQGTRMKVCLPAVRQGAAGEEGSPGEGDGRKREDGVPVGSSEEVRPLVLLVDDDDPVRRVARRILENAGYRVLEARSGEEALSIYQARNPTPGVVVSDVVMPGVSGFELIRELRKDRPNLPALLMTGYTEPGSGDEDLDVEVLRKPFDATDLVRRVGALLT